MSNTRIFWIIWCTMWALGWLLVGFFTFFLGWLMVPVSLLAILLPIGKEPAQQQGYPPHHGPPNGWTHQGQQQAPPNGPAGWNSGPPPALPPGGRHGVPPGQEPYRKRTEDNR